jgi:predicted Zn-dependent protease
MAKQNWTLEQLKSQLSRREDIKDWIITEENTHRRERYFMAQSDHMILDQDRNITSRNITVRLSTHLPTQGRQGEITKKFFYSVSLKDQIDAAVEAALQTDHQAWDLPTEVPSSLPELKTTDPRMAEDIDQVMGEVTTRFQTAVNQKRETNFNSAELFLSVHHRELHLSNGLRHRSSQSRVYAEAAFSFARKHSNGKTESDEYLSTQWAVNLDDLPVEKLFHETSDRAFHSLDVIKPSTGKYAVIVDAEVLSTLLHGHVSQLSASNAYNNLPYIKPGDEFIAGATGDLISISLDPSLPYGASTVPVSEQGLVQTPLQLVNENRVIASPTDKQYGDYLGLRPTTTRGNIVIQPGKLTYQELTQQAPIVIEILQFSGLFADANSGTFSSEIRLAKLYNNQNGMVSYIKGGSLSGSISENFKGLKMSSTRVNRSYFSTDSTYGQGYFGPDYALLSDVSIVG